MNSAGTKSLTVLMIDNDGLSHYTSYLAHGLSKYMNILLYGFSKEDYIVTGANNDENIEFHFLRTKMPKMLSIIFQPVLVLFKLLRALVKRNYNLVHIQGHLPMFFLYVYFLKFRNKPICWTLHDVHLRPSRCGLLGKLESYYVNLLVQPAILSKYAVAIIVHSSYLKNQLISMGVEKSKIHVLPHFDYNYLLKLTSNSSNNMDVFLDDYVLFFGRIVPYKGIEILINAARILKEKSEKNIKFLISGNGDISYIRHLLNEEDYQYIFIRNEWVTYEKIPEIFKRAKFLVLPYTDASQSGILSLAYTFSKPVIISNLPSLVEYVEQDKTGLIVEVNDSKQLANCMTELIENDSKCIEMGKRGYQKMVTEMSLELCCEKVNKIYNNIVKF